MSSDALYSRYQELRTYVGWTEEDDRRIQQIALAAEPHLPALVDDFYEQIERSPHTRSIITGGAEQIQRLKGTLIAWLNELLRGPHDQAYVERRSRVGWRHVEIGLDQVYTNAALSRLRHGLMQVVGRIWQGTTSELLQLLASLNLLLDLDLAIIEDAYQQEYLLRQQRVERLAAIGQVSGGVAHELRNPLNVVKTSVYYLLNARSATPEKQAEHLRRIEKHVSLADGVITALSNFTRMPVPQLLPLSPCQCIQEALETNPVPGNIDVQVECSPGLPRLLGDADQIRIVLGNLIRNAREAMSEGGSLRITAGVGKNQVMIAVADTGAGIPPDELKRITEPLYSTKARGLGLGLAIARAILEKHHGRLQVVSQLNQGSTFTLWLPAEPAAEVPVDDQR